MTSSIDTRDTSKFRVEEDALGNAKVRWTVCGARKQNVRIVTSQSVSSAIAGVGR
jgi:hypothetical protein